MGKSKILLLLVLMFLFTPTVFGHAATLTETFDSYTSGNSINGGSGGNGWSGNWTASSVTASTSPLGGQGGKSMYMSSPGLDTGNATRVFSSAIATGTVSFKIYTSINQWNNVHGYYLRNNSSGNAPVLIQWDRAYPDMGVAGRLIADTGSGLVTIADGLSANTWHTIVIKWGETTGKFRVSVNGGQFSSEINTFNNVTDAVDTFQWANSSGQTFQSYVDDIKFTPSDSFDSYANGASLNSGSGGHGWGGNWTATSVTASTSPSGGQGGKSMYMSSPGLDTGNATRAFSSAVATGTISFRIYTSINQWNNVHSYILRNSSTGDAPIIVQWDRDYPNLGVAGRLVADAGGGLVTIADNLAANTWHSIVIKWNETKDKFKVSVDGAAFTSNIDARMSFTDLDTFQWTNSSSQTFESYVDDVVVH